MTAVVYARISDDRSGVAAGVARQQEDCLAWAARLGLTITAVLVDNDVSAFDEVARPGYDALLRHLRAGVSRVVVWHLDRLYGIDNYDRPNFRRMGARVCLPG